MLNISVSNVIVDRSADAGLVAFQALAGPGSRDGRGSSSRNP